MCSHLNHEIVMPTSAVVITLEPSLAEHSIEALRQDERLLLGERHGPQLPAVIETSSLAQSIALVERELLSIPGVLQVHVVQIDFEDVDYEQEPERLPRRRQGAAEHAEDDLLSLHEELSLWS